MSKLKKKIAVILPCYKSKKHVLGVLKKIPNSVTHIYCVDDACPQKTGKHIKDNFKDKRLKILNHKTNQGVGGALITGYKQALKDKAEIIVKIDSDGQMNPSLIPNFTGPILDGRADYTKGNRFFNPEYVSNMPPLRLWGNAGLSFLSKFSTGYWQIFDPTNGYTAIHATALKLLPLDKISKNYFFESDMLFRLNTIRAVVLDIPQQAIYGDEESNLKVSKTLPLFAFSHLKNFFKRIVYGYFVRDFHVASLEWVLGPLLLLFSLGFGINSWIENVENETTASAGTVMLAALPFIAGLQLLLSALHFDIQNQPKNPLQNFKLF